ncbi:MAG: pyridoxal-phosphate dependent enzyme [Candidatus Paceibacterota bacterium]
MKKVNNNFYLNTFEGSNSVLDYLNPDNAPYTPLVEIPDILNPYRGKGVRIFAKLMNALPLANTKSLPAYNMLLQKKKEGEIPDTVIENSSGNTVFSLAVIARLMGVKNIKAIVSHEVSRGKLNILRLFGVQIIVNKEPICPDPTDPTSGIYKAKIDSVKNDWFNPGQYDNQANPEAHYKWTGPQIWEQSKGKVSIVSVGLGTTGSASGIGKFLKEQNKNIEVLGVSRIVNNPVPGVRTNTLLREISFDWKSVVGPREEVGTNESYSMSMNLCRHGILAGPSSGFAFAGLLKYLSKQSFDGKEKIAVFVCPDGPFPYIDEYFEAIEPSLFPKIENENLLNDKHRFFEPLFTRLLVKELDSKEIFKVIFSDTIEKIWIKIKNKEKIEIKKDVIVVDLRDEGEYQDHHIPQSVHVPFHNLDDFFKKNKKHLTKNTNVIFVCRHGNKSRLATYKASLLGINGVSLKGGDSDWSRLNFPRVRADQCVVKFELN